MKTGCGTDGSICGTIRDSAATLAAVYAHTRLWRLTLPWPDLVSNSEVRLKVSLSLCCVLSSVAAVCSLGYILLKSSPAPPHLGGCCSSTVIGRHQLEIQILCRLLLYIYNLYIIRSYIIDKFLGAKNEYYYLNIYFK